MGGVCLFLPRGLSLPLLVGYVMSEGDCVWGGSEGHYQLELPPVCLQQDSDQG